MEPIPYGKHHITSEDISAVTEVLQSSYLTAGPLVKKFEEEFAKLVGAKYAVAVSNGTAALHLSCLSLGLKPQEKVITTPITFAATANSVLYCGGQVEFCDIDPQTFCLDHRLVEEKLKNSQAGEYSGIIFVDFGGTPADLRAFHDLAKKYNLWLIEDACHAPGASFYDEVTQKNITLGSGELVDLSVFSFHPVKHIATGEGGMITTNNPETYKRLLSLRGHGIIKSDEGSNKPLWYQEMHELGYNYRLSDIHAALGLSQIKKLIDNIKKRNALAQNYLEAFKELPFEYQKTNSKDVHAYHLFVILTDKREELYYYLREKNIFCQIHYVPVHHHPYYQKKGHNPNDHKHANNYYKRCLTLPLYPTLKEEEQNYIIKSIQDFFISK